MLRRPFTRGETFIKAVVQIKNFNKKLTPKDMIQLPFIKEGIFIDLIYSNSENKEIT